MNKLRTDSARALLLGLLTILTALPFVSRFPFNWDAAQFLLGTQQFSVAMHQPHPPGYPAFIAIGNILDPVISAHWALVGVSLLAGATTVAATYLLMVRIWPNHRARAFVLATILMINPALWMFRSVGLTYTIDAAAVTVLALFTYRVLKEQHVRSLLLSALAVALAGGFRPSLLTFLFPLLLLQWVSFWTATRTWQPIAIQWTLLTVGIATWAIPLVLLSGGLTEYRAASGGLFGMVAADTSLFRGATLMQAVRNAGIFVKSLLASWGVIAATVAVSAVYWFKKRRTINRSLVLIVTAWIIVPTCIYAFVHFGQIGYVVIFTPLTVLLLMPITIWLQQKSVLLCRLLLGAVVLSQLFFFLIPSPQLASPDYTASSFINRVAQRFAQELTPIVRMNRLSIVENDRRMKTLVTAIEADTPEEVVVVSTRNLGYTAKNGARMNNPAAFRELGALLPRYRVIDIAPSRNFSMRVLQASTERIDGTTVDLPSSTRRVIIVADQIEDDDLPTGIAVEKKDGYYEGEMNGQWKFSDYRFLPEG
jgi:hypothetical protein